MTATSTISHLHDVQVSTPDWPTCGLEVRREHPPCLRHDRITASDGIETIVGVECRVICDEAIGMHPRDLDRLADTLEAMTQVNGA